MSPNEACKESAVTATLRVALFTDCFREANGVATLSREFVAFTQRRQLPFLCVHSSTATQITRRKSLTTLELKRSLTAFPLDRDLRRDHWLSRYKNRVGILGLWVAHSLGAPLAASWHTNLHEYAAQRLNKLFSFLPDIARERVCHMARDYALRTCLRLCRMARLLLAPKETMVCLRAEGTGRRASLMAHGVDTEAFSPRWRRQRSGSFCIGYVGRLTPEKNVRSFVELERRLLAAGQRDFRFVLAGEGGEKDWLRKNLRFGETPDIRRGEALAEAFANMDVFVSRPESWGGIFEQLYRTYESGLEQIGVIAKDPVAS